MNFVDRGIELKLLDDLYQRPGAQFLVLYGRRRVGKTRLLTHWLERLAEIEEGGKAAPRVRHCYWMATQTSAVNQLRAFSQELLGFLNPGARIEPTFSYASWEAAIEEAGRAARGERLVVVLDEFTYVMQANPEVPSLVQRAWDHRLRDHADLLLILTGSLAGIIQRRWTIRHRCMAGQRGASGWGPCHSVHWATCCRATRVSSGWWCTRSRAGCQRTSSCSTIG